MGELGITPAQAHYVLTKMLDDRKVTRRDVAAYLGMMEKEINDLEKRLQSLRSLKEGGSNDKSRPSKGRAGGGRKSKVTAQQKASRKLQGVYMSMLRRIPKNKRAQYKTLATEKGRQAAVDAMKAALGL